MIIVTGTGRSGTSTVARILHTRLNVCMGHSFSSKNSFEENTMLIICRSVIGFPKTPAKKGSVYDILRTYERLHKKCSNTLVGFKSPHLSGFTNQQWKILNPRLVIRTSRAKELVVASMNSKRRSYPWEDFYTEREQLLSTQLVDIPVFVVDFGNRRIHDTELVKLLTRPVTYSRGPVRRVC